MLLSELLFLYAPFSKLQDFSAKLSNEDIVGQRILLQLIANSLNQQPQLQVKWVHLGRKSKFPKLSREKKQ